MYRFLILIFLLNYNPVFASDDNTVIVKQKWSWQGLFGSYDKAQLRRGLQVFREICAACHGLERVRFNQLLDIGMSIDYIKEYADESEQKDGFNQDGEPIYRSGLPSDKIPSPYVNELAARLDHHGAMPPDLSVITKARAHGPDYIYSVLTGYENPPEGFEIPAGRLYNTAYPGNVIVMGQFIYDESVEYEDGSPNDAKSLSRDVVAFLNWAAEPELEARKSLGVKVIIFILIFTMLMYALKVIIWKDIK